MIKNHLKYLHKNIFEIFLLTILILISIYFRFRNLIEWQLFHDKETKNPMLLKSSLLDYFSKGSTTTSFISFYMVVKLFFFINSFPQYRYLTASIDEGT